MKQYNVPGQNLLGNVCEMLSVDGSQSVDSRVADLALISTNNEMRRAQDNYVVKRRRGTVTTAVKERYLRKDIACNSSLCSRCCYEGSKKPLLPADVTHYIIPDYQLSKNFMDILEAEELKGIIFLQTVVNFLQIHGGRRINNRLRELCKHPSKGCVVFSNEFHEDCYVKRSHEETLQEWQTRSIFAAAEWLNQHLEGKVSIVILTEELEFLQQYRDHTIGLFVLNMKYYLETFLPSASHLLSTAESILESLKEPRGAGTKVEGYIDYLPNDVLLAGLESGKFMKGYLRVSKHNSYNEAVVQKMRSDSVKDNEQSEVFIPGQILRNRAIHGDLVVAEVLPKNLWTSKINVLSSGNDASDKVEGGHNESVVPTGQVVGILQRYTRQYVACMPEENDGARREVSEKVLVIPWDCRIPKIRIATRQAEKLKNHRILVQIDSWDVDSFYPNGHFVKTLGQIGHLETEIRAVLIEHGLDTDASFSQGVLEEMPIQTADKPFKADDAELNYRRDLRESHLIFSIDPVGCEDVDDTLSVRMLKKGKIELGVHIADVTHFVKANSLTDLEASRRATTVYLADRRYDMLPSVLSADLCSLINGVDRYAVSVIWKFDKNLEVCDVWYGRTVIRSSYKLFYEAAQAIADGKVNADNVSEMVPEMASFDTSMRSSKLNQLKESILLLMSIARHLKQARNKSGALDLESSEVQIEATEGSVKALSPKKALEIHETVAECMIFANQWVARKIEENFPNNALLRHHPIPRQELFSELKECAAAKGFTVDTSSNSALAASLDRCIDPNEPEFNKILRGLATQAMSVASYFSTGSLGRDQFFHYGLALDRYTHFTSPIRRYADVIVHRMLLMAVDPLHCSSEIPSNEILASLCQRINIKHRESQNAQQDSIRLFQALYFREHEDDETRVADAIVFKLKENGALVTVPRYGIKGAVYLKNKEGLVATPTWDDGVEFGPGSIVLGGGKLFIAHTCGETMINLFDRIQVRIHANLQRAHLPSLTLELVSLKTSLDRISAIQDNPLRVGKEHFLELVKEDIVEKEKREQLRNKENAMNLEYYSEYAQTCMDVSLYGLFQRFRKSALLK